MIAYLAGWSKKKDGVFRSVGNADVGDPRRLPFIGLSMRHFAESAARTREALAVAKKKPRTDFGKWLKYRLIWAQYNWSRRYFSKHPDALAMCWNGLTGSRRAFMAGAKDAGAARLFAELAPFPGRVTLDHSGVNAQNSLPREASFYTDWAGQSAERRAEGWRTLGESLTARASRRSDVGQGGELPKDVGNFLFCPLQVPNDSQITLFADWVQSVEGMLDALAQAAKHLPNGWHIRIKEHPSAKSSLAVALSKALAKAGPRLIVDNQTDTFAQVAAGRGVITINSSVGLQAFFHDKPVITLGKAFFAIPGLVTPVGNPEDLARTCAQVESLWYDPDLRAAFMNYLDQVYYPKVTEAADGAWIVDESDARRKLAQAREAAKATPPLSQPGALR